MEIVDRWPPPTGSDARVLFVLLAERHTNATRAHIGRHLGISGAGMAYLFRIGEARLQSDRDFAALVREGESRLATTGEDANGVKSKVRGDSSWSSHGESVVGTLDFRPDTQLS
jgi:hypothetical protein